MRSADERGGGGEAGDEEMRGNRDWYPRGSSQGMSFNSYRKVEDNFYKKEQIYKSDKPTRPPYPRHDTKYRRRDGGDYHGRSRHSEVEMTDEPLRRTPEDKKHSSPVRERSKKTSRRSTPMDKPESATENTVSKIKMYITAVYLLYICHIPVATNSSLFRIANPKNLRHPRKTKTQNWLLNVNMLM